MKTINRFLRLSAAVLCAALLLPVCAACAVGEPTTKTPTAAGTTTAAGTPTAGESGTKTPAGTFDPSDASPTTGASDPTHTPTPADWRDYGEISSPVTKYAASEELSSMSDTELARFAAAEGMVLLKNDNGALPLKAGATAALFGKGQIDFIKGGTGSGEVNALYTVNLLEGMRGKAAEGKISLNETLAQKYESGSVTLTDDLMKEIAGATDNAIVVISRVSGENVDLNASQFTVNQQEKSLLNKVCGAGFKHVVVVLNVGAVMSVDFLDNYKIDALLLCWQPGLEGGNATADVLCGDVNPSGKLVDTIAKKYEYYGSAKYFAGSEYATYTEDIFVGYRYFETFDPDYEKVAFPFGYGLSYTSFDISEPFVRENNDCIETQVLVTNTGNTAGKEVVQVYYSAPTGKLGAPGKALAGFAKTRLLQPGESEKLTVCFAISDMAMYDDTGLLTQYAYILEKGDYRIYVGNSIRNADERGVCFTHRESADRIVQQLDGKIAGTTLTKRMTADGTMEKLDTTVGYTIPLSGGTTIISSLDYLNYYEHLGQKIVGHIAANSDGSVSGVKVKNNAEITYKVDAPFDGDFELSFGYGMAGSAAAEKALSVVVNGKRTSYDLNGTGGLYSRKTTKPTTVSLKKGGNYVTLTTPADLSFTFLLIDLTFDHPEGSTVSDLTAKYQKQSLNVASGEKISFMEVYENPEKLNAFVESLTPEQMIYLLIGHSANVGRGDGSIAGLRDLDVPCVDLSDGPAGLDLAVKQVAWPIETCLACSFDTSLLYAVGVKVGDECYAAGVDIILGPGINIHRDPLGGRNFEYYSEDPLVTGKMASAFTQGVQAKGTAGVMPKHFYANNREAGRVNGNSSISERAARMIYMKAFEICVKESKPLSIMTTYNLSNGIFNAENKALLDGVVRGEWGFEGFFCTDWGSHSENAREIAAGNDVKMMFDFTESDLAAYRCGYLSLETLRASAARILETALHSGTMERTLHPVVIVHEIGGNTRVKAVEMTSRTPGVNFEECLDEDGGVNPNYLQNGAEITYTLNVTKPGSYKMSFRVASENNSAAIRVYLDGEQAGVAQLKRGSGGWQIWTTIDLKGSIDLPEGEHELKFVFGTAVNLNWFEFKQ